MQDTASSSRRSLGWLLRKFWPKLEAGNPTSHPIVKNAEIWGFYAFDWANSVAAAIGFQFLPLLLQALSYKNAGFPEICPNYLIQDEILMSPVVPAAVLEFGFDNALELRNAYFKDYDLGAKIKTEMYYIKDRGNETRCDEECINGFCISTEFPGRLFCLEDDGETEFNVRDSNGFDPTSFATLFISFSIILQAVFFIVASPIGDFLTWRKRILFITVICANLLFLCTFFLTPANLIGAGVIMILSNAFFGVAIVAYNAFLPVMAKRLPLVIEHSESSLEIQAKEFEASEITRIGSRGFAFGYTASLIAILLVSGILVGGGLSPISWYKSSLVITAFWWLLFSIITFVTLEPRPGPNFPAGSNVFTVGFRHTWDTFRKAEQYRKTFVYLLLWFLFSDGVFTIGSVGVLISTTLVEWPCAIGESVGIAGILLFATLFGAISTWFMSGVQRRYDITDKAVVIGCLVLMASLAAYGALGMWFSFGLKNGYEMWAFACVYGCILGPIQSASRTLMSLYSPSNEESRLFALYEITDKGSSWMGPMVTAAFAHAGNVRMVMFYIMAMVLVPLPVLVYYLDPIEDSVAIQKLAQKDHEAEADDDNETRWEMARLDGGLLGAYDEDESRETVFKSGNEDQVGEYDQSQEHQHTNGGSDASGADAETFGTSGANDGGVGDADEDGDTVQGDSGSSQADAALARSS